MHLVEALDLVAKTFDGLFSKEVLIALTAAVIGAKATSKATEKTHEYAKQKSKTDEANVTRNTLILIKVELETAWNIYISNYGSDLLSTPETTPFLRMLPLGDNMFPIYDSAPPCLANVNPVISAKIVRIHMRTKGLITMIKLNNADFQTALNSGKHVTQNIIDKAIADGITIDEKFSKKLGEHHDFCVELEAKKMGMGYKADAIKSMTKELGELLKEIKTDIDRETIKIINRHTS